MEVAIKPWHGIPRNEVNWHPIVDESRCIGCGMCVTGCGRNVYGYDYGKKTPVVLRPNNCMVACVTCSNTCLKDAISFPPVEGIRNLIREKKVLAVAKKELDARQDDLSIEGR